MAVKIHHAKKTLLLLDVLGGGGPVLDLGGVIGRWGRTCRRDPVAKKFQSWNCENAFF
jgi:hypothetical protein